MSWSRGRSVQVQKCTLSLSMWVQNTLRAPHSPPECQMYTECQRFKYEINHFAFRWGRRCFDLGEQLVGTVWGDFWHGDYHKAFSMTLISVRIYLVLQGVLSDGKRKAQAQIQACCEVMPISTTFWFLPYFLIICRVGQNRIYTYIYTVYLVISKPKIPYVHRIYMVLANPNNLLWVGLARTVYAHRIRPYVWWFPCQIYLTYTVYTYKCMVLANPSYEVAARPCRMLQDVRCNIDCQIINSVWTPLLFPTGW